MMAPGTLVAVTAMVFLVAVVAVDEFVSHKSFHKQGHERLWRAQLMTDSSQGTINLLSLGNICPVDTGPIFSSLVSFM